MKRFLTVFLVIALLFGVTSCASTTAESTQDNIGSDLCESSEQESNDEFDEEDKEDKETDKSEGHESKPEDSKENTEHSNNSDKETGNATDGENDTDTDNGNESEGGGEETEEKCSHIELENGKCKGCNVQFYLVDGDVILFGEYPQVLKSDSVTIVSSSLDSRGYHLGSDNAYYAKVTAKPYGEEFEFSTGKTIKEGIDYYFKVEPIRWRIISNTENEILVLCESILINKAFDTDLNKYVESDVAKWLREDFFANAFHSFQKEIVHNVLIDNSNEQAFLISEAEAFGKDTVKKISTTDFARANGAWMSTSVGKGNGIWWLRDTQNSDKVKVVTSSGMASNYELVNNAGFGVVPALKIIK